MLCLASLLVFSILGIFSATHRALAKEAWSCVGRRVTLRPCDTGFKEKIKSRVVSGLAEHSTFAARVFNRHSEVFAWIFTLLTLWSLFGVVRGGVNFYLYGSCNGLNATGFCIFDPTGANNKTTAITTTECTTKTPDEKEKDLNLKGVTLANYPHQPAAGAEDKLVFIGCYSCDYTRKAYPQIQALLKLRPIDYTFIHFPVKPETEYLSTYAYCANKLDPAKFWALNDSIFASEKTDIAKPEFANGLVTKAGYDLPSLLACTSDPATAEAVKAQRKEVLSTKIYGTPTIFINDRVFVGPKPDRVYKRALKGFVW